MDIKQVDINDIKLNPTNPRVVNNEKFEKLIKSIKEFPEMLNIRPIVVDSDMTILGGNMRYKAAVKANIKIIPIIIADNLTAEQRKEFIIKDNSSFGEWDWEVLQADWDIEQIADWGIDIPDFDIPSDIDPGDNDEDDNNIDIEHLYQITINFSNEEDLHKHFNSLTEVGYECKILQI